MVTNKIFSYSKWGKQYDIFSILEINFNNKYSLISKSDNQLKSIGVLEIEFENKNCQLVHSNATSRN